MTDITKGLEAVSTLAVPFGGWVVSSKHDQKDRGSISIRVPADKVDEALVRLRGLAVKVESETSTSQDFTDEFVDTQARVRNFQATEAALIRLLEKAEIVEDALRVQAELTKVQQEIERLQGRLSFLEQTSAFSLINISLKVVPAVMQADAGPDQTVREGEPVRFRASFVPPEGITDFTFKWEFGDGSGRSLAPTLLQAWKAAPGLPPP